MTANGKLNLKIYMIFRSHCEFTFHVISKKYCDQMKINNNGQR